MDRLTIQRVGPIEEADVTFGDLTVLVGPQATGKSIALQCLKLLEDTQPIRARLRDYGIEYNGTVARAFQTFFGEGMDSLWRQGTQGSAIAVDGKPIANMATRLGAGGPRRAAPAVFYIPAQRALTMHDGWPRPFSDYSPGDPFTVRDFSDTLRLLMEGASTQESMLFPRSNRLKAPLRDAVDAVVFHGFGLEVDRSRPQKRLVLAPPSGPASLPFMVWSAGQREFVPLLLGLYWLIPPARLTKRREIEWAIVEEPEMGLHPRAIGATMLLVLELLSRGYRVCLSTHSPHVLDIVWALQVFRRHAGTVWDVLSLFEARTTPQLKVLAEAALSASSRVYFFPQAGPVRDISDLDPGADTPAEAGWGGLTEFSGRIADAVARVVSRRAAGAA